jgi:hypothetical protein
MKPFAVFDIESFANYFLVMFLASNGKVGTFEMYEGQPLDTEGLSRIVTSGLQCCSFHGLEYDTLMLAYAMQGASCSQLKALSDDLVTSGLKYWEVERKYGIQRLNFNHVDLRPIAPGKVGLKIYGGRLHCKRMQESPVPFDAWIMEEDRPLVREYCLTDLDDTRMMREALAEQVDLRYALMADMEKELRERHLNTLMEVADLRCKSDAQIAEAVLKQKVFVMTGAIPRRREPDLSPFKYEPPPHIQFRTPELQELLRQITESVMYIKAETGHVEMPPAVKKARVTIGNTTYKLGIGGLHSQEETVAHKADAEHKLLDIDVRSYYPFLILNMGMYPTAMGPAFLRAYRDIVEERVRAKDAGEKTRADSLKITVNGTFGKTSSKWSILYYPKMMVGTTLTGQLSILMLIEVLERYGFSVVSANTDGIVVRCPVAKMRHLDVIVATWESVTKLETERTEYVALYSRDVNSYVAVKPDGKTKTKGFFNLPTKPSERLWKSPQNEVCIRAALDYITKNVPIEETIRSCRDITGFLTVRRVDGGAIKDGAEIGAAIRWYYSTDPAHKGVMRYITTGNAVPRTKNARACLELPDEFPDDVDLQWYIDEARNLLAVLAVLPPPPKAKLPRRGTKLWKKLEAEGLVETDEFDKPQWCVRYEEIPDEYKAIA